MVKNLSVNAGDTGSSPGLGGSHMPRSNQACEPQLLKPVYLEPMLNNKREATAMGSLCTAAKGSSRLLQLEKACVQQ